MLERGITEVEVREVLETGRTIEEYPDRLPTPARLILGWVDGSPLHVVRCEVEGGAIVVVTGVPTRPRGVGVGVPPATQAMKCAVCIGGTTVRGRTTVTLDRAGATVVFRDVPAEVCTTCGEAYMDSNTTAILLGQAEAAIKSGVTLEVRSFAA